MAREENRKPNTLIKWISATVLLVAVIMAGSFIGGTFYPNIWTVEKMEKEFHKKELLVVQALGLKQPDFQYTNKQEFLSQQENALNI